MTMTIIRMKLLLLLLILLTLNPINSSNAIEAFSYSHPLRSRIGRNVDLPNLSSRRWNNNMHDGDITNMDINMKDQTQDDANVFLTEDEDKKALDNNKRYINSLLNTLQKALDHWFTTGSPSSKQQVLQLMDMIYKMAHLEEDWQRAIRMVKRATFNLPDHLTRSDRGIVSVGGDGGSGDDDSGKYASYTTSSDGAARRSEAQVRKDWESKFQSSQVNSVQDNKNVQQPATKSFRQNQSRSALSQRVANTEAFMSSLEQKRPSISTLTSSSKISPKQVSDDKDALERALSLGHKQSEDSGESSPSLESNINENSNSDSIWANNVISTIVAKSGPNFTGDSLEIGGLDNVLDQIKRRIWVPLAAPPQLLHDLGIQPVRGLLLYGAPGCGKTLLARKLGSILSPMRPITLISGPEIMDKYVGSSEANLRDVFDNPPPIHEAIVQSMLRELDITNEKDLAPTVEAIDKASLHVIVMDEFDAMARARGGSGGNSQGDAGVARDSLVNQMLAKMDGVDALPRPTLVIGLTNKRDLIEPALLRSGRFEVQIEVPPPSTVAQRVAILKIHMHKMFDSGRLLVRDAPSGSPAWDYMESTYPSFIRSTNLEPLLIPTYDELLESLARDHCVGFSGANLAGVCRAAASHALERAVASLAEGTGIGSDGGCLVTTADFELAVKDVLESTSINMLSQNDSTSNGNAENTLSPSDDTE